MALGSRIVAMRPVKRSSHPQSIILSQRSSVKAHLISPPARCPVGLGRQLCVRPSALRGSSQTGGLSSKKHGGEPLDVEVCTPDVTTQVEARERQQAGASGRSTVWRPASWDLFRKQPQTALLLSIAGAFTGVMGAPCPPCRLNLQSLAKIHLHFSVIGCLTW
jgi:hypothetical protein